MHMRGQLLELPSSARSFMGRFFVQTHLMQMDYEARLKMKFGHGNGCRKVGRVTIFRSSFWR
jgi:hypothetical protein